MIELVKGSVIGHFFVCLTFIARTDTDAVLQVSWSVVVPNNNLFTKRLIFLGSA